MGRFLQIGLLYLAAFALAHCNEANLASSSQKTSATANQDSDEALPNETQDSSNPDASVDAQVSKGADSKGGKDSDLPPGKPTKPDLDDVPTPPNPPDSIDDPLVPCDPTKAGRTGTVQIISNETDLLAIKRGHSYKLDRNILLTSKFKPVPRAMEIVLDGAGFTVRHLFYTGANAELVGLIGHLGCSIVKNLNLTDVNLAGQGDVGTLAGTAYLSQIDHVQATSGQLGSTCVGRGPQSGNNCGIGGLIGAVTSYDSNGPGIMLISDSLASVNVTGPSQSCTFGADGIGGLIGLLSGGNVIRSSASGNLAGAMEAYSHDQAFCAGGLIGAMDLKAHVDRSFASGNVAFGGGLVGYLDRDSHVNQSYSSSNVGVGAGLITLLDRDSSVSQSYATGNVADGIGLVGILFRQSSVVDCYAIGLASNANLVRDHGYLGGDIRGFYASSSMSNGKLWLSSGVEQTTSLSTLKTSAPYTGFDFTNVWKQSPGELPKLKWQVN